MTNLSRVRTVCLLFFGVLILAATSWAQTRPPIAERIAKTYGLDSFEKIDAISYTFNLQLPGVNLSRSWVWQPKTDQVTYEGKDKDGKLVKATYVRSQLNSQPANVKDDIDPSFLNDNYWLLFPFHAYWDTDATVTDQGLHKLPVGKRSAKLVEVKYPGGGSGYSPGDTWELYVGKDHHVEYLVYRRGVPAPGKPSLVTATWAGYKKAGPLLISTEHRGTADGKPLHLFLSDVSVKLTGSDTWIKAK